MHWLSPNIGGTPNKLQSIDEKPPVSVYQPSTQKLIEKLWTLCTVKSITYSPPISIKFPSFVCVWKFRRSCVCVYLSLCHCVVVCNSGEWTVVRWMKISDLIIIQDDVDTVLAQVRIFRYKSIDTDLSVCRVARSIGGKCIVVVVNFVLKCQFSHIFPIQFVKWNSITVLYSNACTQCRWHRDYNACATKSSACSHATLLSCHCK